MKYISKNSNQYFAFNIWDIQSAKSVIDGASLMNKPIILQTSMKAFSLMDLYELRTFVRSYSDNNAVEVYLHLDHCKEISMIEQAIDNGWDSVMIDASDKSLEENIEITNRVKELIADRNVLLEAEVGQIVGVEDEIVVTEEGIANINDVTTFIANTDVDMLAVAVGTAHGLYKKTPQIHYELIEQVGNITDTSLVVHGGSGLSDDTLSQLLSYSNVKKINISTEVKQAYRQGIVRCIENNKLEQDGFNPLVVMTSIQDEITGMTRDKLSLLSR